MGSNRFLACSRSKLVSIVLALSTLSVIPRVVLAQRVVEEVFTATPSPTATRTPSPTPTWTPAPPPPVNNPVPLPLPKRSCSFNWGCQDVRFPGVNPAYSDPSALCPGNGSIADGATLIKIIHQSPTRGTGYLWSTNLAGEILTGWSYRTETWICDDGVLRN